MGKSCAHCNIRDRKSPRIPSAEEMEVCWVELKEQITSLFRRDLVNTIPSSVLSRMMQLSETLLLGDLYQLLLRFKSLVSRLIIENKNTLNHIFVKKITSKALALCLLEHVIQNFKVMINSGKALQKCLMKLQNKIHVDIYVLCINLFRLYYFEDPHVQEKITQSLDSLTSNVKLEVASMLNDTRFEIKQCAQLWPNIEQIIKKLSEKPENTKKKKAVKETKNQREPVKKPVKPIAEQCPPIDCSRCVQSSAKNSTPIEKIPSASTTSSKKSLSGPSQNTKQTKYAPNNPYSKVKETPPKKVNESQLVLKGTAKKPHSALVVLPPKEKNSQDIRDIDSLVAFINGKIPVTDHVKTQKAKEKKKLKKEKRKLKKIQETVVVNTITKINIPIQEVSRVQANKNISKSDHNISKEQLVTNRHKETAIVSTLVETNKKEKKKKSQDKATATSTSCTQTVSSSNHAELLAKLQRSSQVSISAVTTNCSHPVNKDLRSSVKDITAQISTITVSPKCDAPFTVLKNMNNNNINKQLPVLESSEKNNGSRMVSIKRIDSSARGPTVTMTVKGENSNKIYYLMRNGQADTKTYNMFRNINNTEKEKSAASHAAALKTISFDNSEITLSNTRINKSPEYCNTDTLKLSKYLNEIEIIPIPNPVSEKSLANQQSQESSAQPSKKKRKHKKKKNIALQNECSITACNINPLQTEFTKKQKSKSTNNEKNKVDTPVIKKNNKILKGANDSNLTKDRMELDKIKKQNESSQVKNTNVKNVTQQIINLKVNKKQIDTQHKIQQNIAKNNNQNVLKKDVNFFINDTSKSVNGVISNGKKKKNKKKSKEINPEDLQLPGGITVIKLKSGEDGIVSKTKTTLESVTKMKNNRKFSNCGDQKFRQPVNPFSYSYFSQDQSAWNNGGGVEFGSQDLLTYFNQKLSLGTMQNNPQLIHSSQPYLQPKVMQAPIGTPRDNISNYEAIDSRHAKTAVPPRHDFDSRSYDHGGAYPPNYWPMHFGADNVFAPKEGIDPTTLDAEEAEIEQFKRFCNEPVSRARREPTHLNMTGIFKKKN